MKKTFVPVGLVPLNNQQTTPTPDPSEVTKLLKQKEKEFKQKLDELLSEKGRTNED